MNEVYILEHVYESDEIDEIKFIGVFRLESSAKLAVEFLRDKPGFKDHSIDCFQISEVKLDKYEWKEGFISWEDGS
jgi:hypothetical protein